MVFKLVKGTTADDVLAYVEHLGPLTIKDLSVLMEDRHYTSVCTATTTLLKRGDLVYASNPNRNGYRASYKIRGT